MTRLGSAGTRRQFLRGAGVAAVAAGGSILSGCGQSTAGASGIALWSQLAGSKEIAGNALEASFRKAYPRTSLSSSLYGSPDQLNEKLLTGMIGGVVPDVFIQHWDYSIMYASGNKLRPLSDVVAESAIDHRFAAFSRYGGELVTVPLYGSSRALTINKALARKAGLDVKHPPATWEELRGWAREMTRREGGHLQTAGMNLYTNDLEAWEQFVLFLQGAGGSILSPDGSAPAFDSDAGVAALTFMASLIREDRVTDAGFGIGQTGATQVFLAGRVGMQLGGNYGINAATTAAIDLGIARFPGQHGGATSLIDPFSFGIPVRAADPEQAGHFIANSFTATNQAAFAAASKNVPALPSAQKDPRVLADPALAAFVDAAAFAPIAAPVTPAFSQLVVVVARALENVFYGKDQPAPALRAAAAQMAPFIRQGAAS